MNWDNRWTLYQSWGSIDPTFDPINNNLNNDSAWFNAFFFSGFSVTSQSFYDTVADMSVSPVDGLFQGNLNKLARSGGKLIVLHTWPDDLLPISQTIGWYNKQKEQFNGSSNDLRKTMRFFTKQDGGHCNFDMNTAMVALMDWVEKGKSPTSLSDVGKAPFDRPACEYPNVPIKKDPNGSLLDSTNWKCVKPDVATTVTPALPTLPTVALGVSAYNGQPTATFEGHEYKYVRAVVTTNSLAQLNYTRDDARSVCLGLGAGWDLASVHSQAENDFIVETVMGPNGYFGYLGGVISIGGDNKWYWLDDPAKTIAFWDGYAPGTDPGTGAFVNWWSSNGEPNRYQGIPEDYVAIFGHDIPWGETGKWMDVANDNNLMPPVCKK